MEDRQKRMSILMFPWLAHGHLSPYLELAKRLTTKNFYIYFCSTPINLNSLNPKLSPQFSKSIQFVQIQLPNLPDLPPHYHTTNGLPPHLMNTLKKALDMASPEFFRLLKTLNPDLVVYDFIQPWAASLASSLNIPSIHFFPAAAGCACFLHHLTEKPDKRFPFPELADFQDYVTEKLDQMLQNSSNDVKDMDRVSQSFELSYDIVLVKSFKDTEGKYLNYLSILLNKKMVPVGPLVQETEEDEEGEESEKTKHFMSWLDRKERCSTLFVSFGSEYFLTKEEIEEIAYGLELTGMNFIWVLRFPFEKESKIEDVLPKGYLDRVSERGLIVEKWAPQVKILRHGSIGGFVSHCGWSSVMESMWYGVPIVAMPMHLDQPINARIVENVGVGVEVRRNKNGGIESEEMSRVIREVVMGKEEGENVRKRAKEMSYSMRKNREEEMDVVIDELVKICGLGK